jgi:hypothetical protein
MQVPEITIVKDRPVPKDVLQFYGMDSGAKRLMFTITDSVETWQKDLSICEKLFGDIVICPFASSYNHHKNQHEKTQEILKQRMKHPDVSNNSSLEAIAKTWILPQKVHMGPDATYFFNTIENPIKTHLLPLFEQLKAEPIIQFLKIEVPNGMERRLIYSFLDEGFRPSLVLVKWLSDIDDDIPTAHCAGHLINSGYSLIHNENGYALYMFRDDPFYDICSMKTVGLENPFLKTILLSVSKHMTPPVKNEEETKENKEKNTANE